MHCVVLTLGLTETAPMWQTGVDTIDKGIVYILLGMEWGTMEFCNTT